MIFKRVSQKCQGVKNKTRQHVYGGRGILILAKPQFVFHKNTGEKNGPNIYFIGEMFRESQNVFVSSACLGYLV